LNDEEVCPANCATATVMGALRAAGDVRDRNVVILGAGMLGLTATAATRVAGAASVIVADCHPRRVGLAEQFGATHAVLTDMNISRLANAVASLTHNRGADFVFEFSGTPQAVVTSIQICRVGGSLTLVGSVFPTDPVPLPPEQLVRRLLTLRGVYNYAPQDLIDGLNLLAAYQKTYDFAGLVEASFPLDQVDEAFHFANAQRPVRVAVRP
jgi:alcohol dehydrogenase